VANVSDDVCVSGEPAQLQQVILNLCTNAAQAMDRGGSIQVSAAMARFMVDDDRLPLERGERPQVFGAGLVGFVGALILGPATEQLGRKTMILVSVLVFGAFALIIVRASSVNALLVYPAFSPSLVWVAPCRTFVAPLAAGRSGGAVIETDQPSVLAYVQARRRHRPRGCTWTAPCMAMSA
jgi:MFS family permease